MMTRKLFCVLAVAMATCILGGCDKAQNVEQQTVPNSEAALESMIINPSSLSLEVGESAGLQIVTTPGSFSLEGLVWKSSDTGIATVNGGTVTGVSAGETSVVAELDGIKASCNITVTAKADQGGSDKEWDGKTFTDCSQKWSLSFTDKGGWWAFELLECSAPYHLIKYAQEGDDFFIPYSVCHEPIDIERAYQFFCVDVDASYLTDAVSATVPDMVELLWPDGNGYAHGYVFGFNSEKKFTGEYAILKSEVQF